VVARAELALGLGFADPKHPATPRPAQVVPCSNGCAHAVLGVDGRCAEAASSPVIIAPSTDFVADATQPLLNDALLTLTRRAPADAAHPHPRRHGLIGRWRGMGSLNYRVA
jgi:hypothetical protein